LFRVTLARLVLKWNRKHAVVEECQSDMLWSARNKGGARRQSNVSDRAAVRRSSVD